MLLNPSIVTGGVPPRFARAGSNELAVTWVASDRSGTSSRRRPHQRATSRADAVHRHAGSRCSWGHLLDRCELALRRSPPKPIAWIRRFGRPRAHPSHSAGTKTAGQNPQPDGWNHLSCSMSRPSATDERARSAAARGSDGPDYADEPTVGPSAVRWADAWSAAGGTGSDDVFHRSPDHRR